MQLGFVSAIFAELPLEKVLAFAGAEGYQCVEVMCWPGSGPDRKFGGVCHIDVDGFTQAMADDVGGLCEKHGVAISALGFYSNPLAADANEAERAQVHLKKVIDAAPRLGLSIVNSFVGAHTKLPLDENMQRFAEVWPDLVKYAEDHGRADRHRKLPDVVRQYLALRHEPREDTGRSGGGCSRSFLR